MKPTSFSGDKLPHRYWEKRVAAAYLRMMGLTQENAARAVGRSKRSLAEWESEKDTWLQAREEARQRWLGELTDAARVTLLQSMKHEENGGLALQVLERIDPDLRPAKQHIGVDLAGEGLAALLSRARGGGDADAGT